MSRGAPLEAIGATRIDFGYVEKTRQYFSCLKPETVVRYLLKVQKMISFLLLEWGTGI